MKFAYKMILGTTLIISILFSIGGIMLIQQNYQVNFDRVIESNIEEHVIERYSMEQRVRSKLESGMSCTSADLIETAKELAGYGEKSNYLRIYADKWFCSYSNLADTIDATAIDMYVRRAASEYELMKQNGIRYMILGSEITVGNMNFTIVNIYNINSVYDERDRQLESFIKLDVIIVVIAVIAVFLLSILLTRPIKRLSNVSTEIANGAYFERTKVKSKDEIGELSVNFNRMADAIEEKISDLQEEISNREDFISDFSHEMKTPMTSIMGYSKLLTNVQCDRDDRLQYADRIYRECKRLETLSRKMLKLMEIDDEVDELSNIDTTWLGEEIQVICGPIMDNVELKVELQPANVIGDSVLILDLLKNLVDNGHKACSQSGIVRVSGCMESGRYRLQVKDNGCGIPKEEISRIMEPFYMVDKSRDRKQGGSGLGLALCRKICSYHKTELQVESDVGEGTTMSFLLEVKQNE